MIVLITLAVINPGTSGTHSIVLLKEEIIFSVLVFKSSLLQLDSTTVLFRKVGQPFIRIKFSGSMISVAITELTIMTAGCPLDPADSFFSWFILSAVG